MATAAIAPFIECFYCCIYVKGVRLRDNSRSRVKAVAIMTASEPPAKTVAPAAVMTVILLR